MTPAETERHSIDRAEQLDQIVAAFLEAVESGEQPSQCDWIARHPDFATELDAFFRDDEMVRWALGPRASRRDSGERFADRYLLHEAIGFGSMGVVHRATDLDNGAEVALKILPAFGIGDPREAERFHRGIEALLVLDHPNIIPILDYRADTHLPYLAMPLVVGKDLKQLHRLRVAVGRGHAEPNPVIPARPEDPNPSSPLSLLTVASPDDPSLRVSIGPPGSPDEFRAITWIGIHVARALDHAHNREILHRDIKPSNLMLDISGNVLVADFGLAKSTGSADLTERTDLLGTLRYMAPERFRGWCDPRSDIYSLGLTLYEILLLRPAFPESERTELVRRIVEGAPPRPRKLRPEIPRDLETILLRAIDPEPAHRYPRAREFAEDLARFDRGEPVSTRPLRPLKRVSRWAKLNPLLALTTTLLLVSVLAGSAATATLWLRAERNLQAEKLARKIAEQRTVLALDSISTLHNALLLDTFDDQGLSPDQVHRLEEAHRFYTQLILLPVNENESSQTSQITRYRAAAQLGNLEKALGRPDDALRRFRDTLNLEHSLWPNNAFPPRIIRTAVDLRLGLGDLLTSRGQDEEADRWLAELVALASPLAEQEPGDSFLLTRLSRALDIRSAIAAEAGRMTQAWQFASDALPLLDRVVQLLPNDWRYRVTQSQLCSRLASLAVHNGQMDEGWSFAARALSTASEMHDLKPANDRVCKQFAAALITHAEFLIDRDPATAESDLVHALRTLDTLAERLPSEPTIQKNIGNAHQLLGHIYFITRRFDQAESSYEQVFRLMDTYPQSGTMALRGDCMRAGMLVQLHMADLYRNRGSSARNRLDQAEALVTSVLEKSPGYSLAARLWPTIIDRRALESIQRGDPSEAADRWAGAADASDQAGAPSAPYRAHRIVALLDAGRIDEAIAAADPSSMPEGLYIHQPLLLARVLAQKAKRELSNGQARSSRALSLQRLAEAWYRFAESNALADSPPSRSRPEHPQHRAPKLEDVRRLLDDLSFPLNPFAG